MRVPARGAGGFTLVEVLVALAILSLAVTMAWQGVDAIARSRTAGQEAVDRALRLQTVVSQWEQDLQAVQASGAVPALRFDGANLTLTRATDNGLQLVTWSMRDGALWRWSAPAVARVIDLQDHWMRSQQLLGNEPNTLRVLAGVSSIQVYFFRGNAWTNAQSSGDPATEDDAAGAPGATEHLPGGVRLVLALESGSLTRDIVLAPQSP
jgi:general secretion pathway protein J